MADDDEEDGFGGLYEDGHWLWDDSISGLVFISEHPLSIVETVTAPTKAPTGTIEFRDDIDLIEQLRFRRRYQRKLKLGQPDIITLQDVKDLAIYTAPINILSPMLINMLHLPTTERFIRALILCCQYYLQVADEMAHRMLELDTKIRTPVCEVIEHEFRDNLADLRLLVAKEYCTILIELEVNRIFKSEIFNSVEHTLRTGYIVKMAKEERDALLGGCVKNDKKLTTRSPLVNEVFCHREIDYRMLALGVTKCPQITPRLLYLLQAVAGSEEEFLNMGVTVGILGMSRSVFDTMLRPLPTISEGKTKSKASMSSASYGSKSSGSMKTKSSQSAGNLKIYPDIILPHKGTREIYFPPTFPSEPETIRPYSETQRRRWQTRLMKILHPTRS